VLLFLGSKVSGFGSFNKLFQFVLPPTHKLDLVFYFVLDMNWVHS